MAPATTPRRLVGVSTKMYFSAARTASYTSELVSLLSSQAQEDPTTSLSNVDIFLIPDHVTILPTIAALSASPVPVLVGAQDAHSSPSGAFTGEVSPAVLAEVGCRIVELGHAERRRLFGETDADAAAKAAAAAEHGMAPLVCVGEKTKGDVGVAVGEVEAQVRAVVEGVDGSGGLPDDADLILAYEPVWAIGAAEPAGAEHVVAVGKAIREFACVRARSGRTRILYGGSAGPGLFEKLKEGVDGLFLGRFAHDPKQFVQTIKEVGAA